MSPMWSMAHASWEEVDVECFYSGIVWEIVFHLAFKYAHKSESNGRRNMLQTIQD